jgi:hypothetical protein
MGNVPENVNLYVAQVFQPMSIRLFAEVFGRYEEQRYQPVEVGARL